MDYLYQRNRAVARMEGRDARPVDPRDEITAADKHVVVIGGGDTGMDCISNAMREGAASATLLDVYPEVPSDGRYANTPWPEPPRRLATTYALDEGGRRTFARQVTAIEGDGNAERVHVREVTGDSSRNLQPVEGSEMIMPAELVLIAIGFTHPEHDGAVGELGVGLDSRGNIKAPVFSTSEEGVFATGDARVGASLIVTAIADGRRCARAVEGWLRERA
jgi:glutamate synthase (NADPH/NADH) small chain